MCCTCRPIHPIGKAFRKGKNNNPVCQPGEPGSPWAIGALRAATKRSIPELGTLEGFQAAGEQGARA